MQDKLTEARRSRNKEPNLPGPGHKCWCGEARALPAEAADAARYKQVTITEPLANKQQQQLLAAAPDPGCVYLLMSYREGLMAGHAPSRDKVGKFKSDFFVQKVRGCRGNKALMQYVRLEYGTNAVVLSCAMVQNHVEMEKELLNAFDTQFVNAGAGSEQYYGGQKAMQKLFMKTVSTSVHGTAKKYVLEPQTMVTKVKCDTNSPAG